MGGVYQAHDNWWFKVLNRMEPMTQLEHWVLTFVCPDQPGIVHAISGAVVEVGGNITESQQFTSEDTGRFFMRLQIEAAITKAEFASKLEVLASKYRMDWKLDFVGRPMRTLVLASKAGHCLNDLLFRQKAGQLPIEIPSVVANHSELAEMAGFFSIPFESLKITSVAEKADFESRLREIIKTESIELIVLARFMQILSPEFCKEFEGKIINIHHSFLPGFKGANPYAQAHARGVKLIGATAHFVTEDLDEGPIIEQNVTRVEHSDSVRQLVAIGQDAESKTLTQAVRWFAEHRVLLDGSRTIIFR
jgi:formyltetrahydrofolate deformylase